MKFSNAVFQSYSFAARNGPIGFSGRDAIHKQKDSFSRFPNAKENRVDQRGVRGVERVEGY